jgi:hypothetical protein
MSTKFDLVKEYLGEMKLAIIEEDAEEELVVVDNEEKGIKNMIVDCEDVIVIIEQLIMKVRPNCPKSFYIRLLQMNRELVHGAFALDSAGEMLIYRDSLELKNLDFNELEGSINALSLAMSEYGSELVQYASS